MLAAGCVGGGVSLPDADVGQSVPGAAAEDVSAAGSDLYSDNEESYRSLLRESGDRHTLTAADALAMSYLMRIPYVANYLPAGIPWSPNARMYTSQSPAPRGDAAIAPSLNDQLSTYHEIVESLVAELDALGRELQEERDQRRNLEEQLAALKAVEQRATLDDEDIVP